MYKLFINGKIYTMENEMKMVTSLLVKKGLVHAYNDEAKSYKEFENVEVIDLEGHVLMPSFIESHAHPLIYANNALGLNLKNEETPSISAILNAVKTRAKERKPGEWILGAGWDDSKLAEKRFPTREELDEVAPNNPVFLKRTDAHNAVANSLAFEMSNLSLNHKDPQGGHFDINEKTGKLSGLIQENAMDLFDIPSPTIAEQKEAMLVAQEDFFKWGVTTVHEMAATKDIIKVFQSLQKDGRFKMKVRLWLWAIDQLGWKGVEKAVLDLGLESNLGSDYLNIQGLKYMLDGAVGGRTAAVRDPFEGEKDNTGILYMEQETINNHVSTAIENDLRVSIHAIGERAMDMAVKSITQAASKEKNKQLRNRIEHCALATEEHMHQMKEHEIIAASSIGFIYSIGDSYFENLGKERTERIFPHASFKRYGLVAPGNSDLPVCEGNPIYGIYAAVTRRTVGNKQLGTKECIPVYDALKAYTIDAAYAGKDENILGTLEKGKYADMIILSADPLEIEENKLKDIYVKETFIEGNSVYKK